MKHMGLLLLYAVALASLCGQAPDDTRGKVVYMVSLSAGESRIENTRTAGQADLPVTRGDVFVWRRGIPAYLAVGYSHGREALADPTYRSVDTRNFARADYVDAVLGARLRVSSHVAFYMGFGSTWLSKGYVRSVYGSREIDQEDITRLGSLVHFGAVLTDTYGLSANFALRSRNLHGNVVRGDAVYLTQYGGLELTAGIGWEFGRPAPTPVRTN